MLTTTTTTTVKRDGQSIELAVTVAKVPSRPTRWSKSGWAYEVRAVTRAAGAPWAGALTTTEEYEVVVRSARVLDAQAAA